MNTAEQILVIVLAATLAVFLILAIVIAVQVIRILRILKEVSLKAQSFIDSAEAAADMMRSTVGKFTVMKFAHSIIEMVTKHKTKGE